MKRSMVFVTISVALLLAGCGGTPTPQSALNKRFQSISKLYPFHANVERNSRLYFFVPKPTDKSYPPLSPVAAVLYRYKDNWSVWEYASIPNATAPSECDESLASIAFLTASPRDLQPPHKPEPGLEQQSQPKHTLLVGRLAGNSGPVGSLVLSLGGRSYPAHLLPDGFWFVNAQNANGSMGVTLKDDSGQVICSTNG